MEKTKIYVDWSRLSRQTYVSGIQVIARNISEAEDSSTQIERVVIKNGKAYRFQKSQFQRYSSSLTLLGRRFGSKLPILSHILGPALRKVLNFLVRIQITNKSITEVFPGSCLFVVDTVLDAKSLKNILALRQKNNMKLIVLVHDLLLFTNIEAYVWNSNSEARNYFELVDCADKLIVASFTLKNQLLEILGKNYENKIFVIDFPPTQISRKPQETKKTINRSGNYVLGINKFDKRKNWDLVIDLWLNAYEHMKGYTLICVGSTGDNLSNIRKRVKDLQKLNYPIEIYVDMEESEKLELLESAKVLLVGSTAEGYGLPLVEALQAGCLCFAPELDVYKDHHSKWGGITFYKPESLIEASVKLAALVNDGNFETLKKSIKYPGHELNWSKYVEKVSIIGLSGGV
jgi:glycosyltransferase involved in cell wall biosynthesis